MSIHDNEDIGEDPGPEPYEDDLKELGDREAWEDAQREQGDVEVDEDEEEPCEVCGSKTCSGCCDCGDCPRCEQQELSQFADPGGQSALRAASASNPRNLPCPTCGEENRLTPADRARGYQCDSCAARAEGNYSGGDY